MEISKPNINHIPEIIALAKETWQATYSSIISQEQIEFMLAKFYNEKLIQDQMKNAIHHFLICSEHTDLLGYSHCVEENGNYKLSKLYFYPSMQGKGLGKNLLLQIEHDAKLLGYNSIILNVNRNNPAFHFYSKMGFEIQEVVDIPLDKFWLNDYIMSKGI